MNNTIRGLDNSRVKTSQLLLLSTSENLQTRKFIAVFSKGTQLWWCLREEISEEKRTRFLHPIQKLKSYRQEAKGETGCESLSSRPLMFHHINLRQPT